MEQWQRLIVAGNKAFHTGNNTEAEIHYRDASRSARQMIDCWFDTEGAINALVVTDLNLAECQCRMGCFEQAIDTYSSLSLDLRKFQLSFAPSNPIVGMVARALTQIKKEFLTLTQTYAYDILQVREAPVVSAPRSSTSAITSAS
ncbi:hypothetical protein ACFQ45_06700 [Rhodanobacter aciditrophus]|uniref:Tetratricopeptide repeat protein n=1 Tax=Rhodanobacter aciditrophus TaxID=1623218 RepID=A0ABW4AZ32_9GAMM